MVLPCFLIIEKKVLQTETQEKNHAALAKSFDTETIMNKYTSMRSQNQ